MTELLASVLEKLAREGKLESALSALENAAGPSSGHTRPCIQREIVRLFIAERRSRLRGHLHLSLSILPALGESHISGWERKRVYAKEWEGLSVQTCLLYAQFRMNPSLNCLTLSCKESLAVLVFTPRPLALLVTTTQ